LQGLEEMMGLEPGSIQLADEDDKDEEEQPKRTEPVSEEEAESAVKSSLAALNTKDVASASIQQVHFPRHKDHSTFSTSPEDRNPV
jgi:hypothetical protein